MTKLIKWNCPHCLSINKEPLDFDKTFGSFVTYCPEDECQKTVVIRWNMVIETNTFKVEDEICNKIQANG